MLAFDFTQLLLTRHHCADSAIKWRKWTGQSVTSTTTLDNLVTQHCFRSNDGNSAGEHFSDGVVANLYLDIDLKPETPTPQHCWIGANELNDETLLEKEAIWIDRVKTELESKLDRLVAGEFEQDGFKVVGFEKKEGDNNPYGIAFAGDSRLTVLKYGTKGKPDYKEVKDYKISFHVCVNAIHMVYKALPANSMVLGSNVSTNFQQLFVLMGFPAKASQQTLEHIGFDASVYNREQLLRMVMNTKPGDGGVGLRPLAPYKTAVHGQHLANHINQAINPDSTEIEYEMTSRPPATTPTHSAPATPTHLAPATPTNSSPAPLARTPSQSPFKDTNELWEGAKFDSCERQFKENVLKLIAPWDSFEKWRDVCIFMSQQGYSKELFVNWSLGLLAKKGGPMRNTVAIQMERATAEGKYIDPNCCLHDLTGSNRSKCAACFFDEKKQDMSSASDSLITNLADGSQRLAFQAQLKQLRAIEFTDSDVVAQAPGINPKTVGCRFLTAGSVSKFGQKLSAEGLATIIARENPLWKVTVREGKTDTSVFWFTPDFHAGEESGFYNLDSSGIVKLKRSPEPHIFDLTGKCAQFIETLRWSLLAEGFDGNPGVLEEHIKSLPFCAGVKADPVCPGCAYCSQAKYNEGIGKTLDFAEKICRYEHDKGAAHLLEAVREIMLLRTDQFSPDFTQLLDEGTDDKSVRFMMPMANQIYDLDTTVL